MEIALSDAETHLTGLVRRAEAGEEAVLTRRGAPVAPIYAAYARYGRGALDTGDLFAYDAAMSRGAALLHVGEDFTQTDMRPEMAQGETG